MEQQPLYNGVNFSMGMRGTGGISPWNDPPMDTDMWGGIYGRTNATTICTVVNAFLCPSDTNPGADGRVFYGGDYHTVAATSYGPNLGLNRFNFGGKINGPVYYGRFERPAREQHGEDLDLHRRDEQHRRLERVDQGQGGRSRPSRATGSTWSMTPVATCRYDKYVGQANADWLAAQDCQNLARNKNYSWKGEWWAAGGHPTYSHTQTPNRRSCFYDGLDSFLVPGSSGGQDWDRGTITMISASSNHPGGVNCLFMDGTVRFIKNSVNFQAWYGLATPAGGEIVSSDSY